MGGAAAGRASVSGSAVVGRATVGRASVRPSAPSGLIELDAPPGSDIIHGGGPPKRPVRQPASAAARNKRRRRRNIIIAAFAAFIMIAGITVVAATYYWDDVTLPNQLALPQSTTIFYADGKTQMAKVGSANRTLIPPDQMPMDVQHAVVSAEEAQLVLSAVPYEQRDRRRPAGRVHDHPAVRPQRVPAQGRHLLPEAARGGTRDEAPGAVHA